MEKILVSSCLLGNKVRHDGSAKPVAHQIWEKWQGEGRLVPLCPEFGAGFPVPRPAAEIIGGGGQAVLENHARVVEDTGQNRTDLFIKGAELALAIAQKQGLRLAILTDGSPSCGSSYIYDGTFSGARKTGEGVVTALLRQNGLQVFGDEQIELADAYLRNLEENSKKG